MLEMHFYWGPLPTSFPQGAKSKLEVKTVPGSGGWPHIWRSAWTGALGSSWTGWAQWHPGSPRFPLGTSPRYITAHRCSRDADTLFFTSICSSVRCNLAVITEKQTGTARQTYLLLATGFGPKLQQPPNHLRIEQMTLSSKEISLVFFVFVFSQQTYSPVHRSIVLQHFTCHLARYLMNYSWFWTQTCLRKLTLFVPYMKAAHR